MGVMATTQNPLTDLIPVRARRYVYGLAFLAALVFSIWQASEGDWAKFVAGLCTSLIPLLAVSNTPETPVAEVYDVGDEPDGHGYYEPSFDDEA